MLTQLQKNQFEEILEELGRNLDISETQYNAAVKSYEAVGLYLAKHGTTLGIHNPEILPQGSFMLGTMVQPIHEKDDLDVDLVCQFTDKPASWTQYDLKQAIGNHLKDHGTYKKMLKSPEGRRCWTLVYSEEANYHLDILPSIVDSGYRIILEKSFENFQHPDVNELALRITDSEHTGYNTDQNHQNWMKTNPFGYAKWFFRQASLDLTKAEFALEAIQPLPSFKKEKLPLQRVVQILKRHRDMMFDGNKEKPISIIITTLAARAYQKETSIIDALSNIVEQLPRMVTEKFSPAHGKYIKWIENPVNADENFADKWADNPNLQANFEKWIRQAQIDISEALNQTGLHRIQESFEKSMGSNAVRKTFGDIGERARLLTEQGRNKLDVKVGLSSLGAATIKRHDFFLVNRIKLFPIGAQAGLLKSMYPESKIRINNDVELIWEHTIQPSPLSDKYEVLLHYHVGCPPEVYVIKPRSLSLARSATKLPHVYDQEAQRLCLYYPDGKQWNKSMPLARTVVYWTYEWLYHYEIWLGTDDDWKGGGVHPFSKKKKSKTKK